MPLRDPVAVYNAATNEEANLLCTVLKEAGVEAFPTEDVSAVGTWMGGLVPEIHKPQVWVDRADVERALPVLEEYERRTAERRGTESGEGPPIDSLCDECGQTTTFAAGQRGSVQNCPNCGAFMDVGGDDQPDDPAEWEEGAAEEAEP